MSLTLRHKGPAGRRRARRIAAGVVAVVVLAGCGATALTHRSAQLAAASLHLRIHAGGGAVRDSAGVLWEADRGYIGGRTYSVTRPIAGSVSDALFRTERYGMTGYTFAVPDGRYRVTLHEAEIWFGRSGARVFNVDAQGRRRLTGIDIFAAVGRDHAWQRTFYVDVTGGRLALGFSASVNYAKLSALEVETVPVATPAPTATPGPTATPTPTPSPVRTTPPVQVTPTPIGGAVSWNPQVPCTPTITSVEAVLGNQFNAQGGALEAGGAFPSIHPYGHKNGTQPGVDPECTSGGRTTFVQLNHVKLLHFAHAGDGDNTYELVNVDAPGLGNPPAPGTPNPGFYHHEMHVEIPASWMTGSRPLMPAAQQSIPLNEYLDIQGFVFWDPVHTTAEFHAYSGWELHPVSAWRVSANPAGVGAALTPQNVPAAGDTTQEND